MVDRDLGFNISANAARALDTFASMSQAVDRLANRILFLGNTRAKPTVEIDTAAIEAKIAAVTAKLDELKRKKADPSIDANITLAENKITALTAKLDVLRNKRADPVVDVQISAAQAKLDEVTAKLDALSRKTPSPTVTLQTALFNQQAAALEAKIAALNAQRVDPVVDLQISDLEAKIVLVTAKLDELRAKKADVRIDADIAEFEAKLLLLEAELERAKASAGNIRIGGSNREAEVASFGRSVANLTGGIFGAVKQSAQLAQNFRGLAIVSSISAGLPTVVSLADTLATAAESALLLPGALAGAGAALLTLGIGFSGIMKALGPETTAAQIKKVEVAMSHLSPTARDLVTQLRALGPAWHTIKTEVQNNLFEKVGYDVKILATSYLPVFKTGLGGIATAFNEVFQAFSAFLNRTSTINDTTRLFSIFKTTIHDSIPGVVGFSDAFKNIAVVGATFLPGLATQFSKMGVEFDKFIQKARDDGSLQLWTAQGIRALDQIGNFVKNLGKIFGDLFSASQKAGASTITILNQATSTLHEFLSSGQGQEGLISLFQGIRDTIEAIKPGVMALLNGIAQAISILKPTIVSLGDAFSSIAKAVAPAIPMIARLAGETLGPIIGAVKALFDTFGGLVPLILTAAVAVKGLALTGALITSLGAKIGTLGVGIGNTATRIGLMGTQAGLSTGSMNGLATAGSKVEAGMSKVSSAVSKAGAALPIIGVAVIGVMALLDEFSSHATTDADNVVKGSMSMGQAIQDEFNQLRKNNPQWLGGADDKKLYADATKNVTDEVNKQLNAMDPLARAQAIVTIKEGEYQDALKAGGASSAAAVGAAADLRFARQNLTYQTQKQADAEKTNTDRLIENSNAAASAANAAVAYQQSQLSVSQALENLNKVQNDHKSSANDLKSAQLQLTSSMLSQADAARRLATENSTATTEQGKAADGADAYRNELLKLADQAKGPTRQALLDAAAAADGQGNAAQRAKDKTAAQKDELGRLADMANGPLADAIKSAQLNFETMGGAHATAEQRAKAQKDELLRLANMATGPLKEGLLIAAGSIDKTGTASDDATVRAKAQKDELGILAGEATGPLATAMAIAKTNFDTLGGAHADGITKAQAQKDKLQELANMATGPLKDALQAMANQINGLPSKTITVTADGRYGKIVGGVAAFASGGILPGYTPGRDVHNFSSPTGGRLALSGGEAIMRPEFTRAVGSSFVHGANAAARSGGTMGVRRFMSSHAEGGIYEGPTQAFAAGGVFNNGVAYPALVETTYEKTANAMGDILAAQIQKMIAAIQAAAQAVVNLAGAVTGSHSANVAVVQGVAAGYGWGSGVQWTDLVAVINRESGFNNTAQNPHSTAYGMFQFLDSTWGAYGATKTSDPHAQAVAGLRYISQRYGSPAGAYAHEQQFGWYDNGGIARDIGFMRKMTNLPERVLSPEQTKSFERLVGWLTATTRGGPGMTRTSTDATTAEVVRLRADIQSLGESIRESVRSARPITVEDRSGNPVETGRVVSLALRQ